MNLLERVNDLIDRYEKVSKELLDLREQVNVAFQSAKNIPEFGDDKVLSVILSGREGGKIKPSSIRQLCERGILTRVKVLDKWMFHIPTAIDEFRRHLEEQAELYEVDVA